MTTQEAIRYDNELKEKLGLEAEKLGLDNKWGSKFVDEFVLIMPEDERKGIIFLGEESATYKAGNIRMNLKKAISAGIEWAASLEKLESMFDYFQFVVASISFINNAIKIKLNKLEGYLLYFLQKRNAYTMGLKEDKVLSEFREWYEALKDTCLDMKEIHIALNHLYILKCVDILEGEVFLKEHVVGEVQ